MQALTTARTPCMQVGQMLSFNDADVLPPALRVAMERVRDGADWMPARQVESAEWALHADGLPHCMLMASLIAC